MTLYLDEFSEHQWLSGYLDSPPSEPDKVCQAENDDEAIKQLHCIAKLYAAAEGRDIDYQICAHDGWFRPLVSDPEIQEYKHELQGITLKRDQFELMRLEESIEDEEFDEDDEKPMYMLMPTDSVLYVCSAIHDGSQYYTAHGAAQPLASAT